MAELITNLCKELLRFMERGLFFAAQKVPVRREVKWRGKVYSGHSVKHDPDCIRGLVEM